MNYVRDFHIYALGLWWMYRGLMALADAKDYFRTQGIKDTSSSDDNGKFALIDMLGVRDISIGIFLVAHHYLDNLTAVLTLMAVMGFVKIGDAIVVMAEGEKGTRKKVVEHLAWGAGLLGWIICLAKN
ncbi:hypothetical protein NW768_002427 [Fusarium equiseti]|uniref:Sorbose reductase sou1 n=1 Tax=Fusarium equiseti TaxID=61235 RepID=A0ABQ8RNF0_FUSEQ|nr:hypothetical protein NW768_002427 [Fusarium equiseti]